MNIKWSKRVRPPQFPEQPYVFTSLHIAVVFPLPRMLFSAWVTVAQSNYHPASLLAAESLLLPLYTGLTLFLHCSACISELSMLLFPVLVYVLLFMFTSLGQI